MEDTTKTEIETKCYVEGCDKHQGEEQPSAYYWGDLDYVGKD